MALAGSGKKVVSLREHQQRMKARKRELSRRMLLESLENRQLMAVGPQLIGVQPNEGSLLRDGAVLNVSPRELVFRFDDSAAIDPATLSGIQISRAGTDGIFERAYISTDLGTGGAVVLDFAAVTPGASGNGIELEFIKVSRNDTRAPRITVDGQRIKIEVNTALGLKTTAQDLLTAMTQSSAASALVLSTRLRGSQFTAIADTVPTGTVLALAGANAARVSSNLNAGANLQVEFLAQTSGPSGRNLQIAVTSRDRGGAGAPIITVSGNRVNIELNSNSLFATTAQELVNAVNSNASASSLILARFISGSPTTRVGNVAINYSPLVLSGASDIPVTPAFVGLGDTNREIVFRFAEDLPDDVYRIDVLGRGPDALKNVNGERFNGGQDRGIQFELDLGARIEAVVPQPIVRGANGVLEQRRNEIHVYFNDDDLDIASAQNPEFYQLRYTRGSVTSNDDVIVPVSRVEYDSTLDRAILTFNRNLDQVVDGAGNLLPIGAMRLRIGTNENSLPAPASPPVAVDPGSRFATAMDISGSFAPVAAAPKAIILNSRINNQDSGDYLLDFPGANDEPGNRDNRYQSHVNVIDNPGIQVLEYNFQGVLGQFNGSVQLNAISDSEDLKQRVREVMSLWANYLGVRFVETENRGMTIAIGDMRAIDPQLLNGPGGIAVVSGFLVSNGQPAVVIDRQDFPDSSENLFASSLFQAFMKGVGGLLGLDGGDELPPLTVMSSQAVPQDTELVMPGNQDVVHGQFVLRPESKDIDLYRFNLPVAGELKVETFAERLTDSSLLDSALKLYQLQADGSFKEIAANDDYTSEDSLIRAHVPAGTYVVGVSAKGNTSYDPNVEDSGLGGRSEGNYQLRIDFRPPEQSFLVDSTADGDGSRVRIDGDADGRPGGAFDFWFMPTGPNNTLFVDKASTNAVANGLIGSPFKNIRDAMQVVAPGQVIRIVGNGGADGRLETTSDNLAYEIGFNRLGQTQVDGATFDVPKDVTVMIDAGAIVKLSRARISVGSSTVSVDRSGGVLQSLGIPRLIDANGRVISDLDGDPVPGSVYFTSLNDSMGRGSNADRNPPTAAPGDWGGIDFRNGIDGSDESRKDLERSGLFLNSIVHSNLRFGGGAVGVDGVSQVITPIHMVDSRPLIAYNTISESADAAMSATPNSFKESNFQDPGTQADGAFVADFERVGPDILGNRLTNNSKNGLFIDVGVGGKMDVAARFDDLDVVHVLSGNLLIAGTPGGAIQDSSTPPTSIVTLATQAGGSLAAGDYNYKLVYVDSAGKESGASAETATITVAANGSILLGNLPPVRSGSAFVSRRIYRSAVGGVGPYRLVAQINAVDTTFLDTGVASGAPLVETIGRIRPRLDGSLKIDPGIVMKFEEAARIEVQFGAQLIAEGSDGLPIVMTSADDKRFGAGGTFDTVKRPAARNPVAGDWGGIYAGHTSSLALDYAKVSFAGGESIVNGNFATFNAVEIHQAEARIANSRFENNADGSNSTTSDRSGYGSNDDGVIFVRGSQPVIYNNRMTANAAAPISIDVNSLDWKIITDPGRSSGLLGNRSTSIDNQGALIEGNRIGNNSINGMIVRGQTLTTQSVWDDTDIVHVVLDEITVSDFHAYGGLRLESKPASSLVAKFQGAANLAGLRATGIPLDNDNRIGGAIHVIGQPGFPVILTSLTDDTVGAGFAPDGTVNFNTDNNTDGLQRLPTGPEVNNGVLIDNDVAIGIPGQFAFSVLPGGESGNGGGISARGNTQLLSNIDVVFDFINYIDVGSNGGGINLGQTTITQAPTLVAPDVVVSAGTFAGANGTVRWRVESRFDNGIAKLINTVTFESDQSLGDIRYINYLDEDVLSVSDDLLFVTGTPGQPNFRAFTLDGPERVGFNQGGAYTAGSGLVNATYTGWAADRFADLRTAITGAGAQYSIPGTIDTADLVPFNDPSLGAVFGLADVTTAFAWQVDPNATSSTITTFLELVPTNPGNRATVGDWNGITLQTLSNDRNVATVTEREASNSEAIGINDIPGTSQFLGILSNSPNSGDENARLGFELHGTISKPSDIDVYSFVANGGTEVWIDIDRTSIGLDSVVELIDANGRVLALSDNSIGEETVGAISFRANDISADSANPLRKSAPGLYPSDSRGNPRDLYSTNPRDAGFRIVLPGQSNIASLYHVRVRSSSLNPGDGINNLVDPANLRAGKSTGVYQMQLRLREIDEIPGSAISYADVRYATNGLTLAGVPRHSPLVGETSEQEARDQNGDGTADVADNNDISRAQELGNLLQTDREAISISGNLNSPTDVDWFTFTIDYQLLVTPLAEYLSTIFDIDYADGIGRPDTSIYLFNANGQLISYGLNSNILDDRAGPLRGADNTDLTRGSAGTLDAYLGAIELPAGRYFIAVTNSGRVPAALAGFIDPNATNPLVRLQPANNVRLIVEDHVSFDGGSTAFDPIVTDFVDENSASVGWSLKDMQLYVSRDVGVNATDLLIMNPFTGEVRSDVTFGTNIARDIRDIAFRFDGTLQGYDTTLEGTVAGDRDPLANYVSIDTGNATVTRIGSHGIDTFHPDFANPGQTLDSNVGINVEAITFADLGTERGFFVANRGGGPGAGGYNTNILYEFNPTTGTAFSGPSQDRAVANNFDQKLFGAGTQIVERGRIRTEANATDVSRRLVVTEATQVIGNTTTRSITDGARFTIRDTANFPATFEFNSGPELIMNYDPANGLFLRDGDFFTLDGTLFEFDTGGIVLINAVVGSGIADGSTVTITDSNGVTRRFEYDLNATLSNATNIRVPYTLASTQAELITSLITAINTAGFGARAAVVPGSNRISIANKSSVTPMVISGTGLALDGNLGVTAGRTRIAITEAMSLPEVADAIRAAMPGTVNVGLDGNRLNFSGAIAGDFAALVTRGVATDTGNTGNVSAGAIAINFLAEDTQETIAIRVATAINQAGIAGVSAVAAGRNVSLANATIDLSAARFPSAPLRAADIAPGGTVTGIAAIGGTLFAVSSAGGLYRVPAGATFGIGGGQFNGYVNTSTDLLGIPFTSITAGPRNLEGGRFANMLFATDANGNIWAFNTAGELQPVFANGASTIATGQPGLSGLAFSTLDFNLWHTSNNRAGDPGHGLPAMPDGSRPAFNGGASWYFGFQAPNAHPNATFTNVTDPRLRNSINFPGGAEGVLESKEFSLVGVSASDQPYLYFNYWLQTENADSDLNDVNIFMRDSFRVYAGTENGNWTLLTTNNGDRGPNFADDEFDPFLSNSTETQETFDTQNWRQARVDISEFAGQDRIRLRFEFSTAGSLGWGRSGGRGPEIRVTNAARLQDGQTVTIGGQVFEIEMGASLVMPSGTRVRNGDTVTIEGQDFVFHDGVGAPPAAGVVVPFTPNSSAEEIARALFNAIQATVLPKQTTVGFNFSNEVARPNDVQNFATVTPLVGDNQILTGTGTIGDNPALAANPDRDIDLVRVQLSRGATVTVTTSTTVALPRVDTFLRAFDAQGNELASNNDFGGSTDSQLTFTAPADGVYYIGVSASANNQYSPAVAGTATNGGSTGNYDLRIEVTRAFTPLIDGARIQLGGAKDVRVSAGAAISKQGELGTQAQPIFVDLGDTANEVGDALRNALALQFARGQSQVYQLRQEFLDVTGLTVNDPGPFGLHTTRNEDLFSNYAIPNGLGRTALAAQNNNFEGLYLDDFFIGLTERGEVVLNADQTTTFVADPALALTNPPTVSGIQVGPYQLEIRGGEEYGFPLLPTSTPRRIILADTLDANTRLAPGQNVRFRSGAQISDGSTITVTDGVKRLTFEFNDIDSNTGVTQGNVEMRYRSTMTPSQIAQVVRDVINSSTVQSVLRVTASMINGDLVGATSDTLAFFGDANITIDPAIGFLFTTNFEGDQNVVRDQGQVVVENSTFSHSLGFGIQILPDARNGQSDAPSPGGIRNTVVLNTERLVPGATIMNNELLFNGAGGISIRGETATNNRVLGPVPFAKIVNNTIVGGSIFIDDQAEAAVFDNIRFNIGVQAFADAVVSYNPLAGGGPSPTTALQTANNALGVPNATTTAEPTTSANGVVSLGHGGQLTVRFTDNFAFASGDSRPDLYISEIGDPEDVLVSVSTDGITFRNVGRVGGSVKTVDLDAFGFKQNERILFVRLTDDPTQGASTGISVGADIDAVGAITTSLSEVYSPGGTGILVGPNASPTLLNNVIANSASGISVDASSSSTVVGGTLFHRNTSNVTGAATTGQFPLVVGSGATLFVDPSGEIFYPSQNSRLIDSSVNTVPDRATLIAVKQPLGLQASPIIAPTRDINGILRVDDPTVDTPSGLGGNVFKDRGASDRADSVGPTTFVVYPVDNDSQGRDLNAENGTIELSNFTASFFDIQLIDSSRQGGISEGSGIRHQSVTSSAIVFTKNNRILVEGVDYRFGYDSTNGIIRLTPLAGIWASDSVYTIRFLNSNENGIAVRTPATYADGEKFTIVDGSGVSRIFELDFGYRLQVPTDANGVHQVADGGLLTIDDGVRRLTFEYDLNGAVTTGNIAIPIDAADTAQALADKTVAAIRTAGMLFTIAGLGSGGIQIQGSTAVQIMANTSGLIVSGAPGVNQAYGIRIPGSAGLPTGIVEGQSFSIRLANGGNARFEFDTDGSVTSGSFAIGFTSSTSVNLLATAIVNAIARAGLGLTPANVGNGIVSVGGDSGVRIDVSSSGLSIVGTPGVPRSISVPVDLTLTDTATELSALLGAAIQAAQIAGVEVSVIGANLLIEGVQGVTGTGANPIAAIQDIAGNPLRANQTNGDTVAVIQLGEGFDYGDAADPAYPSLNANNGPRHKIEPGFSLGTTVTVDGDARLTDADTDDLNPFTQSIVASFPTNLSINVSGVSAANPGFLSAWIDYNRNGIFENDPSERIFDGFALVTGSNSIALNVPTTASAGTTYARFRLSRVAVGGPTGESDSGEVEDYAVTIQKNPYLNPNNGLDASGDGNVSPIDALQIINFLNVNGPSTRLTLPYVALTPPFGDVNGDGFINATDVINVINYLNATNGGTPAGEGEGDSSWIPALSSTEDLSGPGLEGDRSKATVSGSSNVQQGTPVANANVVPMKSSSILESPASLAIDDLLDDLCTDVVAKKDSSANAFEDLFSDPFWGDL